MKKCQVPGNEEAEGESDEEEAEVENGGERDADGTKK